MTRPKSWCVLACSCMAAAVRLLGVVHVGVYMCLSACTVVVALRCCLLVPGCSCVAAFISILA